MVRAARAARAPGTRPTRRRADRRARTLLIVGGARHLRQSTGNLRGTHTCALDLLSIQVHLRDADGGDSRLPKSRCKSETDAAAVSRA